MNILGPCEIDAHLIRVIPINKAINVYTVILLNLRCLYYLAEWKKYTKKSQIGQEKLLMYVIKYVKLYLVKSKFFTIHRFRNAIQ